MSTGNIFTAILDKWTGWGGGNDAKRKGPSSQRSFRLLTILLTKNLTN